ncbi:hypothetical protein L204_101879 [Cryptococcus depauperatus]|nr:hypothetical protein L204_05528 [Cryptococcus depauperatus CBS 7855]
MSSHVNNTTIPSWDTLEKDEIDNIPDKAEYEYAERDHVLFCIDASVSMHKPRLDVYDEKRGSLVRGKSALQQALESVATIERYKVITGPIDSVALLLYNTDRSMITANSDKYMAGTHVFQPLHTINTDEMKRLVKLVQTAKEQYESQSKDKTVETIEPDILQKAFPAIDQELNVADVLRICNFMYRDGGARLTGAKRVFFVTDNDSPQGNTNAAYTSYNDLISYGVEIVPFFVDRLGHRFNPNLYWNNLLNRAPEEYKSENPDADGLSKLADALNDLVIKNAPKKRQFDVPLKFGGQDGVIVIGVSGYSMISEQTKGQPRYVKMRGPVVKEVDVRTEYTSAETGAILNDSEICQAYQFGDQATIRNILEPNWWETGQGQDVDQPLMDDILRQYIERRQSDDKGEMTEQDNEDVKAFLKKQREERPRTVTRTRLQFTKEEVMQFKSMGFEPQIKIIGFQSPNHLRFEYNIKHAYFIYPNEDAYVGSIRTFAALLQSCLKKNRHALALCRFRENLAPEFCVLIPQQEEIIDGRQDHPPGFHVVPLPYKDDIRRPPRNMNANIPAEEAQIDAMRDIIKRMRFKSAVYQPSKYPNPALALHFDRLQALAFEEDWDPEDPSKQDLDKTLPLYEGIHSRAGEFMKAFKLLVEEDERTIGKLSMPTKRGKDKADVKAGTTLNEWELSDVRSSWKLGTMNKLKVQDLKDWAKFYNVSLGSKPNKANTIDVISKYLQNEEDTEKSAKKQKK